MYLYAYFSVISEYGWEFLSACIDEQKEISTSVDNKNYYYFLQTFVSKCSFFGRHRVQVIVLVWLSTC